MFAACVFEGAEDKSTATVVLHVISQVLAGDVGRPALVRTLDGKPRAVVLVVLQGEEQVRLAVSRRDRNSHYRFEHFERTTKGRLT